MKKDKKLVSETSNKTALAYAVFMVCMSISIITPLLGNIQSGSLIRSGNVSITFNETLTEVNPELIITSDTLIEGVEVNFNATMVNFVCLNDNYERILLNLTKVPDGAYVMRIRVLTGGRVEDIESWVLVDVYGPLISLVNVPGEGDSQKLSVDVFDESQVKTWIEIRQKSKLVERYVFENASKIAINPNLSPGIYECEIFSQNVRNNKTSYIFKKIEILSYASSEVVEISVEKQELSYLVILLIKGGYQDANESYSYGIYLRSGDLVAEGELIPDQKGVICLQIFNEELDLCVYKGEKLIFKDEFTVPSILSKAFKSQKSELLNIFSFEFWISIGTLSATLFSSISGLRKLFNIIKNKKIGVK